MLSAILGFVMQISQSLPECKTITGYFWQIKFVSPDKKRVEYELPASVVPYGSDGGATITPPVPPDWASGYIVVYWMDTPHGPHLPIPKELR